MLCEVVDVVVHLHEAVVVHGEGAGGCVLDASLEHHVNDGVLEHLGVDVEVGHCLVLSQCGEDGVGCCAHAALQREEGGRYDAALHVADEELCHVGADLVGDGVAALEGACLVGDVAVHDAHYFALLHLEVWRAYAVAYLRYHDGLAEGSVEWLVHVVQLGYAGAVEVVELQDYLLCQMGHSGGYASAGGEVDAVFVACILYLAHFQYAPVDGAVEAVAQLLCHV